MLADTVDNERPGTEEIYERAANTSNLREQPEGRGATDVLRDMAMSANRLGAVLLRLRSQWESCSKPERQVPRTVKQFLVILGDKDKAVAAHDEERANCDASYERALNALANRLTDLDAVRDELTPAVMKRGWGKPIDPITRSERAEQRELDEASLKARREAVESATDDAQRLAAQAMLNDCIVAVGRTRAEEDREDRERARAKIGPVIRYWLDQTCTGCGGTRWELVPGTRRQSTKVCSVCKGTGSAPIPQGQEGRWLANYMDQCSHRYQQKMKARRKAFQQMPTIDKLSKRMQPAKGNFIDPEAD